MAIEPMRELGKLQPGERMTVRLVKTPRPAVEYDGVVVADDGTHVAVRAPWTQESYDLGFVRFEPGDVFTEHFWRDRWYSIKEVRGADGALKGWYCDVMRPVRVFDGLLLVDDLELDLWRSADGQTILRLDEDEFAASGLTARDPAAAAAARQALDDLEGLARNGFATFD